jgi:hypothetical protein
MRLVWIIRNNNADVVKLELSAQAHHGHKKFLGLGAHQGLHQGAE